MCVHSRPAGVPVWQVMGRNIRAPRVVLALMSRFLALMSRFSLNGKDAEGQYSTRIRFVASGVNHF